MPEFGARFRAFLGRWVAVLKKNSRKLNSGGIFLGVHRSLLAAIEKIYARVGDAGFCGEDGALGLEVRIF